MGRFRFLHGPDDDEHEPEEEENHPPERHQQQHCWEFVADPGLERALVLSPHNQQQQPPPPPPPRYHQEMDRAPSSNHTLPPLVPPHYTLYFVSSAPSGSYHQNDEDDDIVLVNHPDADEIQRRGASSSSSFLPARGLLWMYCSVVVALLAAWWWIRTEGPPGPPVLLSDHGKNPHHRFHPDYDRNQAPSPSNRKTAASSLLPSSHHLLTWKEFLHQHSHQLFESFTALFYYTPLHILHWWFRWMQVLVHEFWQQRFHRKLAFTNKSSVSDPTTTTTILLCQPSSLQVLHTTFVGQRRAVQAVMDAVQSWNQPYHPSETINRLEAAEDDSRTFAPLLLYFTGMTSSGKVTLAQQLAHALCATPVLILTPYSDGDVVVPTPTTTALSSSPADSLLLQMEQQHQKHRRKIEARIRQHVQQYPRSMILLEDVDEMAHIVQWLGQALAEPKQKRRQDDDATEFSGAPDELPSLRFVCRHTIIVFTSTVAGSRSIARLDPAIVAASARDGKSTSHDATIIQDDPSFLLNIQHEMDAYFPSAISQWMDAVVPFLPITPMHLQAILRRKVTQLSEKYASSCSNQTVGQDTLVEQSGTCDSPSNNHLARIGAWSELTISDAAVEALLHPSRIEYLSWKQKSSQSSQTATTAGGGSGSVLTFSSAGVSVLSDKSMILNKIRALIHACLANDEQSTNDETSGATLPARSERSNQPAVLDVTAANPKELVLKWYMDGNGKVDQSCSTACRTLLS